MIRGRQQQASQMWRAAVVGVVVLVLVATLLKGVSCGRPVGVDSSGGTSAIVQTKDYHGAKVEYMVFKPAERLNWRSAYKACANTISWNKKNMTLASITSSTALAAVHAAALQLGIVPATGDWWMNPDRAGLYTSYWIGYNDITQEGKFTWPYLRAGLPADPFTAWMENQPDNLMNEHCTIVVTSPPKGQPAWLDFQCHQKVAGYVCQVLPNNAFAPLPPMPGGKPTISPDGRGLYSGLAPGVSDSWNIAAQNCLASGTSLVKIASPAENEFVRTTFFPGTDKWLGARLEENPFTPGVGTWTWFTGGDFTYKNWRSGSVPTNLEAPYMIMWGDDGTWNDYDGYSDAGRFAYVCWVPSF